MYLRFSAPHGQSRTARSIASPLGHCGEQALCRRPGLLVCQLSLDLLPQPPPRITTADQVPRATAPAL
jgi:hypothetical protein